MSLSPRAFGARGGRRIPQIPPKSVVAGIDDIMGNARKARGRPSMAKNNNKSMERDLPKSMERDLPISMERDLPKSLMDDINDIMGNARKARGRPSMAPRAFGARGGRGRSAAVASVGVELKVVCGPVCFALGWVVAVLQVSLGVSGCLWVCLGPGALGCRPPEKQGTEVSQTRG